jgi:hypothetical protein
MDYELEDMPDNPREWLAAFGERYGEPMMEPMDEEVMEPLSDDPLEPIED